MRPLQSIAMGLVVIAVHAPVGGFDALPDPLGWVLVLLGVHGLPADLRHRSALVRLALLAGAVSVPLWVPAVSDLLGDTHESLAWAANLPQLGFVAVLCHALADRAGAAGDGGAVAWARLALAGFVVAAVLPVLVFGAGLDGLEEPAYVGASLSLVLLVVLLFAWSARPWIVPARPASPATPR